MKFLTLLPIFCLTIASGFSQSRMNIIPKPVQVIEKNGEFRYGTDSRIYTAPGFKEIGLYLAEVMNIPASQVSVLKTGDKPQAGIILQKISAPAADSAAYQITISPALISASASHIAGALYAAQSLAQLSMTSLAATLPCGEIRDKPRFGYRGMMLDVSRNFFPPEYIKKLLNVLSLYKINTFHWHLTDGPGWRLEIKKYPELTSRAAWRTHKTWKDWWASDRQYGKENDPVSYGGYYTQQQARDIVAYAKTRGITVIPEIEMPGHAEEVMAVYPQLRCNNTKGIPGEFCIGTDSTFTFMQDVITEVMDIFPSTYIHIGGDEAGKKNWKGCDKCQKRIKDNNLKNEEELQSYAIRRMEKFISGKGRKLLGWDEILEGGLAPGSTVMSWRGESGGIEAARMNHDVIMTPGGYCYFDHYQQDPSTQPLAIGGYLPLQKVYSYDPMPAELEQDKRGFVKGAQANLWTEYIPSMEHLDYMIFPRILALSEVVWSGPEKNWEDFKSRLSKHYRILQRMNVNYCRPSDKVDILPAINLTDKSATVTLATEQFNPEIRYTTDGTAPTASSALYNGSFNVSGSSKIKAAIFRNGKQGSKTIDTLNLDFHKALGKNVTYNKPWNSSYPAKKEATFVNGYTGSLTYGDGQWQGFTTDIDVTIDLGENQSLSSLAATFMQITGPGVYMPDFVEISLSPDGKTFSPLEKAMNDVSTKDQSLIFKTFKVDLRNQTGRYIRFFAKNHTGFLFLDEIIVY
jgi:hexosaminidase